MHKNEEIRKKKEDRINAKEERRTQKIRKNKEERRNHNE